MAESMQTKLGRIRPPRVQITYDVETGGAIVMKQLPFIVGILAGLSGKPKNPLPPLRERKFVEIDRDNFDEVLESANPRITFKVKNVLTGPSGGMAEDADPPKAEAAPPEADAPPPGADADPPAAAGGKASFSVELLFTSIEDFNPKNIVVQVPALNQLYEGRNYLRDFLGKMDGNDKLGDLLAGVIAKKEARDELVAAYQGATDAEAWEKVEPSETMKRFLEKGAMIQDEEQIPYAKVLIGQFVQDILTSLPDDNTAEADVLMTEQIGVVDALISKQLNLIMHDDVFQKMEATWRGLHYLVMNTETGTMLKLRVLNVDKADLLKDLQKAVEFDQSTLFKLVYEEEYGTYGGNPYSVLIGDYEFGRLPADMELLDKISGVAAAAHAPFIASAYAKLFDMDDFSRLVKPRDLSKIFESAELIKWRSFRESEDSRYVTLTLPRVMLRLPYGPETVAVDGLDFVEDANGRDAKKYLWGNPAYILGQRITNAFALYNWTAAIRGVEGGGLIENLPTHTFKTDDGDIDIVCPTEIAITDRREKELNDLGFMTICHCKGTDKAAFFGGQTTNLPKIYNTDEANANARISAMLPYILAASRFAHYIKVIIREKVGSFLTSGQVENYLNTWIANYVLLDDGAPQEIKAKYPLREANVKVTDVPGKPGSYRATVFLKPHFQLEELTASIRLVAELPS